ncbi:MAG: NADH-quinone oxidoreductase subunit C [Deltaproteobacteria bacterium]|nr:NADH-quinone oxidoreductase subunit C [Deltaproteobacteria bacterium]
MGLSPEALIEQLRQSFGERIRDASPAFGEATIVIHRDDALEIFAALRDRPEYGFDMLTDITAVDYLGKSPRFEVVAHLYSVAKNHRLRVKIRVVESDAWVHSLTPLWKSANWVERECWDMLGIRFVGHPDPRRILMYEEFVGHPLRKDYPVDKRQPLVPERDPIEVGWKV